MTIAEREQQILRVKKQGFHKELDEGLAHKLVSVMNYSRKIYGHVWHDHAQQQAKKQLNN